MLTYDDLYHPPDVEAAHEAWGANCGPCAVAAVLRRPVMDMHKLFPGFEQRRFVNPSQMRAALHFAGQLSGVTHRVCSMDEREAGVLSYGVACLFFSRPWNSPGVPVGAAYQRSHWVGVAMLTDGRRCYYDINAWQAHGPRGMWVFWPYWEKEILPQVVASYPKADGGYFVRWACEVEAP